jgi:hypothetical protein
MQALRNDPSIGGVAVQFENLEVPLHTIREGPEALMVSLWVLPRL